MKLAGERDVLKIVADQTGTPTYAGDLAMALISLLKNYKPGIYHYSNEGVATWFDFAHEIVSVAGLKCRVVPISTAEYPLPARRPQYSVMSKALTRQTFAPDIPYWRDSLVKCIGILQHGTSFNKLKA